MELNDCIKTAERGEQGTWVQYEDAEFLIRSTHSKAYRRALTRHAKGKSNHRLTKDIEAAEDFAIAAMAEGILIDWKNITEKGKKLPCTLDNRIRVLKIAAPIREFLAQQAQDIATFETEDEQEDAATFPSDS